MHFYVLQKITFQQKCHIPTSPESFNISWRHKMALFFPQTTSIYCPKQHMCLTRDEENCTARSFPNSTLHQIRTNRRQVEKCIQIFVGTHEANTLLAATLRHRMKVIIKTGLAGGRESGVVADGWTEALKNTRTNVTVRQEANNLLTILSASQDRISLVGLDDGHFNRKFNANWSESWARPTSAIFYTSKRHN